MLLTQFRKFYIETFPDNIETLIDYFSVFGGSGIEVDITQPLEILIVQNVLEHYGELYNLMHADILEDTNAIRLLQAIAKGDRRIHSACRRARISEAKGGEIIAHLRTIGILEIEASREAPPKKLHPKQKLKREVARHRISHKLRFRTPFMRFWFYFITPQHKQIETGNFEGMLQNFAQHHTAFTGLVFEELSQLYLKMALHNDPYLRCGSYWDRQVELDILARLPEEGFIVGECKWTNTKINRSELGKLEEKCAMIGLRPTKIYLFAKRGFSNELLQMKNDRLVLVAAKDFRALLD